MDIETLIPTTNTRKDDATLRKDENGKGKELILVGKGKEKIISSDEIDLKEETVIPNWDPSNLSSKKMEILGDFRRRELGNISSKQKKREIKC